MFAQPCTGSKAYKLCGPDSVVDPMNSFLCFNAYNCDEIEVLVWDHSVSLLISKFEVLQAVYVLEVVDNYPQLSAFFFKIHKMNNLHV